ncbi:MAG: hypothetical protein ACYS14_12895, partial [Planctomycetota bacterium]
MMLRIKMFNIFMAVAVVLAIGVTTVLCTRIKTKEEVGRIVLASIDDVPQEYWARLSGKRIFFGHKSVGYNIIDGIRDVLDERREIKLNVVETRDPAEFGAPVFAHSQVGRNTDP